MQVRTGAGGTLHRGTRRRDAEGSATWRLRCPSPRPTGHCFDRQVRDKTRACGSPKIICAIELGRDPGTRCAPHSRHGRRGGGMRVHGPISTLPQQRFPPRPGRVSPLSSSRFHPHDSTKSHFSFMRVRRIVAPNPVTKVMEGLLPLLSIVIPTPPSPLPVIPKRPEALLPSSSSMTRVRLVSTGVEGSSFVPSHVPIRGSLCASDTDATSRPPAITPMNLLRSIKGSSRKQSASQARGDAGRAANGSGPCRSPPHRLGGSLAEHAPERSPPE